MGTLKSMKGEKFREIPESTLGKILSVFDSGLLLMHIPGGIVNKTFLIALLQY